MKTQTRVTETYKRETYPTKSKIDNVTMQITSGSAAGAGASRDSPTGTGAAGAEADGGGKAGSSWSAIANTAGGSSARRNVNITFTKLRRSGQGAAKTPLFEARATRHHARQHAGLGGRNLTELNLPKLWANYVSSENRTKNLTGKC